MGRLEGLIRTDMTISLEHKRKLELLEKYYGKQRLKSALIRNALDEFFNRRDIQKIIKKMEG